MKLFRKPAPAQLLISFLLSLLIVFGGASYLYRPKTTDTAIILYTTAWCGYCKALRAELNAYHIPFVDRDTEKSMSGFLGFVVLGGRGVPVSVIGSQVVYGYDHEQIRLALAKLNYSLEPMQPLEQSQP